MERRDFLALGLWATGIGGFPRRAYGGEGSVVEVQDLDHSSKDGLYSTITWQYSFRREKSSLKKIKLKVPGLKKEPPVMASVKSSESPLIVILNGASGKAEGAMANSWASWLEGRGYNVLTFDSTFSPSMTLCAENERDAAKSGKKPVYGMAGNLECEAGLAGNIIKAFIESAGLRPGKIGLGGLSYGGLQAALLCRKQQKEEIGFRVNRAVIFSPVLSMREATKILDENFSQEWKLSELYNEFYNVPIADPMPAKYETEEGQRKMRVAISRSFFFDLKNVVNTNSSHFRDAVKDFPKDFSERTNEILKNGGVDILFDPYSSNMDRMEAAAHVSFGGYVGWFAEPYWRKRGFTGDFFAAGELGDVLAGCGDEVEVTLAKNDPLNYLVSLERFLQGVKERKQRVNLLPFGGHGGYCNSEWCKKKLEGIFDDYRKPERKPKRAVDGGERPV